LKNRYPTLAAARAENPAKFDAAIRTAVFAAARDIGAAATIRALCSPRSGR